MKKVSVYFHLVLFFTVAVAGNPFITEHNRQINFSNIDSLTVVSAVNEVIAQARSDFKKIYDIPSEKRTWENTLMAIDDILSKVNIVYATGDLLANTHPDNAVRDAANNGSSVFSKFLNEVNMDLDLYHAVKAYSQMAEAKKLQGYKEKYLKETLRDFERNGLGLPEQERLKLKKIQDRIADLAIEFEKNIDKKKE